MSVWYSWTSPSSGYVQISAVGIYVGLEVYTGSSISNLTRIAYGPLDQGITILAEAGKTYQIEVISYGYIFTTGFGQFGSSFILSLSPADVALTAPLAGDVFYGPTNILLQVYLNPANVPVQRVEFYQGTNFLGATTNAPYSMILSNEVAGDYVLRAQAVYGSGMTNGSGSVLISVYPVNDAFTNAIEIASTNALVFGSVDYATSESGEPGAAGLSAGQTCWWTWTAHKTGLVTLSVGGQNFAPFVNVYAGTTFSNLILVASNSYQHCSQFCGCQWMMRNSFCFTVEAGQIYKIQVDTSSGSETLPTLDFGNPPMAVVNHGLAMQLNFNEPPPNDNFENRFHLHGLDIKVQGSTLAATKEQREPDAGGFAGGGSIWYSWKASLSGTVVISTNQVILPPPLNTDDGFTWILDWQGCGDQYDTPPLPAPYLAFGVYTGDSLAHLATVVEGPEVTFHAVAGETYQIAVAGNNDIPGGLIFNLAETLPPPNDNFAEATQILRHQENSLVTGNNLGATFERGEPTNALDAAGSSVWWSWMSLRTGMVTIDLGESDFPFPVSIYTGHKLNRLTLVCQDYGGVSFQARTGESYYIGIGAYNGNTGEIKMRITETPSNAHHGRMQ